MNIKIKKVEEKDAKSLRELYVTSIKDNPDGFIQDLNAQPDIMEFASLVEKEGGAMFVMYYHYKLIGMGALKKHADGSAELCKLHLLPKFKGKGLGRILAEELITKAKGLGYKEVVLHVTKTQAPAIGLYERLGFEKTLEKVYQVGSQAFDTAHYRKLI